jgi:hypothetical protein
MNTFNISYIVIENRVNARNIEAETFEKAVSKLSDYWAMKGLEVKGARNEGEFKGQMKVG